MSQLRRNISLAQKVITAAAISCVCVGYAWAGVQQATIQLPSTTTTTNSSPYHSVPLPLAIYASAKDSQLSDLRVRNAAGEYLSYAWLSSSTAGNQQLSLQSLSVPIFPLQATTQDQGSNSLIEVEQSSDGSVRWRSQSNAVTKANDTSLVSAWLIDASALYRQAKNEHTQSYLIQARVTVPESFQGVAGFSLETSDDLLHWQSASQHQQVLQLRHQNQSLAQLEFSLPALQAKYLRLRWDQAATAPRILGVQLDAQRQNWTLPSLLWTSPIKASQCDGKTCEYLVPRNLPVDSVRVKLAQLNSVEKLTLSGVLETVSIDHHHLRHSLNPLYVLRHQKNNSKQSTEDDHYLRHFQAYRLQLDGKEVVNDVIPVNGLSYLKLRLRSESSNLVNAAPEIEIASMARHIVFLARGAGPYRLEWGQEAQQGAAIDMAMLMPKQADAMGFSSGATVQVAPIPETAASVASAMPTKPQENKVRAQSKWWLWLALLGAVALLGWMVWSSLAKIDQENKSQS